MAAKKREFGGLDLIRPSPYDTYSDGAEDVDALFETLWAVFETPDEELLKDQREKCTSADAEWVVCETPRIEDTYKFMDGVSTSLDGTVDIIVHKVQNQVYCCRTIYKNRCSNDEKQKVFAAIRKELTLLHLGLDDAGVCDIFQVYENSTALQIVMKWCARGDLEYFLLGSERPELEEDMQKIYYRLLKCVYPFYKAGHIHGDLKCEKFVFKGKNDSQLATVKSNLCLCDFGQVKQGYLNPEEVPKGNKFQDWFYFAPENYRGEFSTASDVWAMGVILYMIKFNFPPFISFKSDIEDYAVNMQQITSKKFEPVVKQGKGAFFPYENPCSPELKDLIAHILKNDPSHRLTLQEIMEHPWNLQSATAENKRIYLAQGVFLYKFTTEFNQKVMNALKKSGFITQEVVDMYISGFASVTVDETQEYNADVLREDILACYPFLPPYQVDEILETVSGKDGIDINLVLNAKLFTSRAAIISRRINEVFSSYEAEFVTKGQFNESLKRMFNKAISPLDLKRLGDDFIRMTNGDPQRIEYKKFVQFIYNIGDLKLVLAQVKIPDADADF